MNFTIVNKKQLTQIGQQLTSKNWTVACAESCTGGLLTAYLTSIPGSSAYVEGGIISYSNKVKRQLLGVDELALLEYGAVSEIVARQMCEGVQQALGTDIGLSITGIAGPGSDATNKAVGLVFIGITFQNATIVDKCQFTGTRDDIREQSCQHALSMLATILSKCN